MRRSIFYKYGVQFLLVLLVACNKKTEPGSLTPDTSAVTQPDIIDTLPNFDSPERENWQRTNWVITQLGDLSDKVVADIGAGTGYFTFRIAEKARKVIAVDIEEGYLTFISEKLRTHPMRESLQVETRLTPPDSPGLNPREVDIIFIVNTYHHLENRVEYLQQALRALKDSGKMVIIDFLKKELPIGPSVEEKVAVEEVKEELKAAGFKNVEVDTSSLMYQYKIVAKQL